MNLKLKVDQFLRCLGWCVLVQTLCTTSSSADGDIEQGKKLSGQCRTCHGSYGIAQIPIAPNIAGEPEQYIANQLNAYRSGQRENEIMSVVAKALDDENIQHLAKWYASQAINVNVPDESADHSVIIACGKCHGIDGIALQENTPHLAGESVIYLDTQLKAFRSGKRNHEVMSEVASELSDDQIRKASQWYSAINLQVIQQ